MFQLYVYNTYNHDLCEDFFGDFLWARNAVVGRAKHNFEISEHDDQVPREQPQNNR